MKGFGLSKLVRKTCQGRHVVKKERGNHDRTKIRWELDFSDFGWL